MSKYRELSAGLAARMALAKHEFHFTHSLGQNFILDDELIERIVEAAGVSEGDHVLEIGPGAGVMTRHLAGTGAYVTAVELDQSLRPVLEDVLYGCDNARVVFGDAMKLDMGELMEGKDYSVVANLPYYITADLVQRMIAQTRKPKRITVMVQREAAERMMASIGSKTWCALSAVVQYYGRAHVLMEVPPEAFTPRPHVESVLLGIDLYDEMPVKAQNDEMMRRVISACFAMRRKTLLNNLSAAFSVSREKAQSWLCRAGLDEKIRGEAITLRQAACLSDVIYGSLGGENA